MKAKAPQKKIENDERLALLRRAIDEGDASGLAEGDVFARIRKQIGIPPR
jgi:hypothetical protein